MSEENLDRRVGGTVDLDWGAGSAGVWKVDRGGGGGGSKGGQRIREKRKSLGEVRRKIICVRKSIRKVEGLTASVH